MVTNRIHWGWHIVLTCALCAVGEVARCQEDSTEWMEPAPIDQEVPSDPVEESDDATADDASSSIAEAVAARSEPAVKIRPETTSPYGDIELIRERYPDGTVKIEREVALDSQQNYVNHGRWTMWDSKGVMIARGEYRMGSQHGTWTRWYGQGEGELFKQPLYVLFQGPFRSEVQLRDGKLHGTWTVFDSQNRKASQWEFERGRRHGRSTWWYPNGQVQREVSFQDGQLDGQLVDYDTQRNVTQRITYVRGRELVKDLAVYSADQKKHEGWVLRARTIKNPVHGWWEGKVELSGDPKPVADVRHGKWIFWHHNGSRRAEGTYHLGKRVGDWTWWHENGQVFAKGSYSDGAPDGRWTWWYDSGQRHTTGKYAKGLEQGVWSSWDSKGQLSQVLDYSATQLEKDSDVTEVVKKPSKPVEEVPPPDLQALRDSLGGSVLR